VANDETRSERVSRLKLQLETHRLRVQRLLLHVRYVFGYLTSGFLLSVPISIGSRVSYGLPIGEAARSVAISLVYGLLCLVPFLALIPFSRIDWKGMRVPEFQLFELAVTRSAAIVSGLLCLVALGASRYLAFVEPTLFWTVFVLMAFAWGRIKLQTRLFPEFYDRP
jgi:hypothetical protein